MKLDTEFIEYGIIDTSSIIPEIKAIENNDCWNDIYRSTVFPMQKNTQSLGFTWTPLIYEIETFFIFTNEELLNTPIGLIYRNITKSVLNLVPGTILRGALIRLMPGSDIPLHMDDPHEVLQASHRVHLPVITEPEVIFSYLHMDKHMEKNVLLEISNTIPHRVFHGGKNLRYHLLYDILPPDYTGKFNIVAHSDKNRFMQDRILETEQQKNGIINFKDDIRTWSRITI